MSNFFLSPQPGLNDREAIIDLVYRCAMAIDTRDATQLETMFVDDARVQIAPMPWAEGRETIMKALSHAIWLDTTHSITNTRVFPGPSESTASVAATFMAMHYRNGEGMSAAKGETAPRYLVGGMYKIEAVKDSRKGDWRVKEWQVLSHWQEGDVSVMKPQ